MVLQHIGLHLTDGRLRFRLDPGGERSENAPLEVRPRMQGDNLSPVGLRVSS
jgi:hypothetical protein